MQTQIQTIFYAYEDIGNDEWKFRSVFNTENQFLAWLLNTAPIANYKLEKVYIVEKAWFLRIIKFAGVRRQGLSKPATVSGNAS